METAQTTGTIYRNCLVGGIICNICKYPVNLMPHSNVAKEIARHEDKNKKHPINYSGDGRCCTVLIAHAFIFLMADVACDVIILHMRMADVAHD